MALFGRGKRDADAATRALPQPEKTDEWVLYERGVEYKRRLGLYEAVDEAEAFYAGDQWRGVDAGGLPTPVFNIFKRVGGYFIAQIMSQPVKLKFSPEGIPTPTPQSGQIPTQGQPPTAGGMAAETAAVPQMPMPVQPDENAQVWAIAEQLNRYMDFRWEKDKMHEKVGDALRDAAISGDACMYVYWDPDIQTGQAYTGDFVTALVDNVNVHFGDPNTAEVERQPYILISGRDTVDNLRREAKASRAGADVEKIVPDTEDVENQSGNLSEYEIEDTKASYVIKFWRREDGGISWKKSTRGAVVRRETDLGIRRYPVAFMNWDKRKNCYHGRGFVTGQIQNQRYINKAHALLMQHMLTTSFSKIVYDSARIDTWSPAIGEAVPVTGEVTGAAQAVGVGNFQQGYMQAIELVSSMTRDFMGASDAALGNVKPDNTSAIIAVQQASAVPLENIKRNLYQMVEDWGLIALEYMLAYYGDGRTLTYRDGDGGTGGDTIGAAQVDLAQYRDRLFGVRVDVGPSYYWSELASITTLDNLLAKGVINPVEYLERMPDTVIPQRRELLEAKRAELAQAQAMQQMQMQQAMQAQQMQAQAAQAQQAAPPDPAQVLEALPEDMRERLFSLPEDMQAEALAQIMQGGG